jgi:hypothetical protein
MASQHPAETKILQIDAPLEQRARLLLRGGFERQLQIHGEAVPRGMRSICEAIRRRIGID